MRNIALICLLLLIMTACIEKPESFESTSYIMNETGHNIRIFYYKVPQGDTGAFVYLPYTNTKVFEEGGRGKGDGFSYGTYLQIFDSVEVIFDDTVRIMHLGWKNPYNGHGIAYTSNRSISNNDNWAYSVIKETRRYLESEFFYTFTEQDYTYARDDR